MLLGRLAHGAEETAAALGHGLGVWVRAEVTRRRATCQRCGRVVFQSTVELVPKPYGPALEEACEGHQAAGPSSV